MRGLGGVVAVVLALAAGYFVYQSGFSQQELAGGSPRQQIDLVAIESELRMLANAEKQYFATHASYGTLDQLERDGLLTGGRERRGYRFSVETDSDGFTIVAEPVDADKADWPVLSIDQSMQITRE